MTESEMERELGDSCALVNVATLAGVSTADAKRICAALAGLSDEQARRICLTARAQSMPRAKTLSGSR